MDILTVFANSIITGEKYIIVRVYWTTGKHRKKAVDVQLALTCQDPLAAAEAIAIRYLLSEANIFNPNRTGINLKIVVSKGAIKKMARNKANNNNALHDYGYSLITRYGEAEISVSKDKSWFPECDDFPDAPLINGEALRGIEKIDSEGMGLVAVTRHALDRYAENCGTLDMNTSWKNLHRRLKSRLDKIQLPPNVVAHKFKKYGEYPEIFKHPYSDLHYVFCQKNNHRVLVTVFNREIEFQTFKPFSANR